VSLTRCRNPSEKIQAAAAWLHRWISPRGAVKTRPTLGSWRCDASMCPVAELSSPARVIVPGFALVAVIDLAIPGLSYILLMVRRSTRRNGRTF